MTDLFIATTEELRKLTKREREVYEMERHQGMSREKICEELGIKEETRRSHLARGTKKVMEIRAEFETPYGQTYSGKQDTWKHDHPEPQPIKESK